MCHNESSILESVKSYRNRHGEVQYRRVVARLPEDTRKVLSLFETGESPDDVIEAIAWRKYHCGKGYLIAPDERRAAAVEFWEHVRSIRRLIDPAPAP